MKCLSVPENKLRQRELTVNAIDPKTYRACQEPKNESQCNADWAAFAEAVYNARVQFKIPNVLVIAKLNVLYEDGEDGTCHARLMCGSAHEAEALAAWGYGYEEAERRKLIAKLAAQGGGRSKDEQKELF